MEINKFATIFPKRYPVSVHAKVPDKSEGFRETRRILQIRRVRKRRCNYLYEFVEYKSRLRLFERAEGQSGSRFRAIGQSLGVSRPVLHCIVACIQCAEPAGLAASIIRNVHLHTEHTHTRYTNTGTRTHTGNVSLARNSYYSWPTVTSIMAGTDTEPMSRLLKIANKFNCFYLSGMQLYRRLTTN